MQVSFQWRGGSEQSTLVYAAGLGSLVWWSGAFPVFRCWMRLTDVWSC